MFSINKISWWGWTCFGGKGLSIFLSVSQGVVTYFREIPGSYHSMQLYSERKKIIFKAELPNLGSFQPDGLQFPEFLAKLAREFWELNSTYLKVTFFSFLKISIGACLNIHPCLSWPCCYLSILGTGTASQVHFNGPHPLPKQDHVGIGSCLKQVQPFLAVVSLMPCIIIL